MNSCASFPSNKLITLSVPWIFAKAYKDFVAPTALTLVDKYTVFALIPSLLASVVFMMLTIITKSFIS